MQALKKETAERLHRKKLKAEADKLKETMDREKRLTEISLSRRNHDQTVPASFSSSSSVVGGSSRVAAGSIARSNSSNGNSRRGPSALARAGKQSLHDHMQMQRQSRTASPQSDKRRQQQQQTQQVRPTGYKDRYSIDDSGDDEGGDKYGDDHDNDGGGGGDDGSRHAQQTPSYYEDRDVDQEARAVYASPPRAQQQQPEAYSFAGPGSGNSKHQGNIGSHNSYSNNPGSKANSSNSSNTTQKKSPPPLPPSWQLQQSPAGAVTAVGALGGYTSATAANTTTNGDDEEWSDDSLGGDDPPVAPVGTDSDGADGAAALEGGPHIMRASGTNNRVSQDRHRASAARQSTDNNNISRVSMDEISAITFDHHSPGKASRAGLSGGARSRASRAGAAAAAAASGGGGSVSSYAKRHAPFKPLKPISITKEYIAVPKELGVADR
jgi:hypothetical protein